MYRPAIKSARALSVLPVGKYSATLLTDVESPGLIRYGLIMQFCDPMGHPCFYVAAEENELHESLGGGRYFLCSYLQGKHRNHGSSDEWTDLDRFTQEAIQMFQKGIPGLSALT